MLKDNSIDLLELQELNLRDDDNLEILKIPEYTLFHDKLRAKNGLSMAGFLVHNSLNYKCRDDLSNQQEAHVVITIYLTKSKRINCLSWYRQWQVVGKQGKIPDTGSIAKPKERITKTAEFFSKSKSENETIILSDSNINTNNINSPESMKTMRDKQTSQVSKMFSKSILMEGFVITNTSPTYNTSTIDHIITSAPVKMINTTTTNTHFSDHNMVTCNRLTNEPMRKPRFTTSRAYHLIDYHDMNLTINNDPRLTLTMSSNCPDIIAQTVRDVIRH